MRRPLATVFFAFAFALAPNVFAQAPPAGSGKVEPVRTGSYTVKSSNLKNTLPFNCPSPCTVTMPHSTASWPKGYPVTIVNAGTTTVTVHITPTSTVSGMVPPGSSDILLTAQGNYAVISADKTNNYLAFGQTGTGGGGGGGPVVACARLTNSHGKLLSNTNGVRIGNATCGGGGTTAGFRLANSNGKRLSNSNGFRLTNGS